MIRRYTVKRRQVYKASQEPISTNPTQPSYCNIKIKVYIQYTKKRETIAVLNYKIHQMSFIHPFLIYNLNN